MEEDRDVILDRVVHVVAEVLAVPAGTIGIDTLAADVDAWDSFGHVRIVLALEASFGIEMTMAEIERSAGVAGLLDIVEAAAARRRKHLSAQ